MRRQTFLEIEHVQDVTDHLLLECVVRWGFRTEAGRGVHLKSPGEAMIGEADGVEAKILSWVKSIQMMILL